MIRRDEQSADTILRHQRILGEMWDKSLYRILLAEALYYTGFPPSSSIPDVEPKRLIFDQLERYEGFIEEDFDSLPPGGASFIDPRCLLIKAQDGGVLCSSCFTLEGGARGNGLQDLTKALRKDVKRLRKEAARGGKAS